MGGAEYLDYGGDQFRKRVLDGFYFPREMRKEVVRFGAGAASENRCLDAPEQLHNRSPTERVRSVHEAPTPGCLSQDL